MVLAMAVLAGEIITLPVLLVQTHPQEVNVHLPDQVVGKIELLVELLEVLDYYVLDVCLERVLGVLFSQTRKTNHDCSDNDQHDGGDQGYGAGC